MSKWSVSEPQNDPDGYFVALIIHILSGLWHKNSDKIELKLSFKLPSMLFNIHRYCHPIHKKA